VETSAKKVKRGETDAVIALLLALLPNLDRLDLGPEPFLIGHYCYMVVDKIAATAAKADGKGPPPFPSGLNDVVLTSDDFANIDTYVEILAPFSIALG